MTSCREYYAEPAGMFHVSELDLLQMFSRESFKGPSQMVQILPMGNWIVDSSFRLFAVVVFTTF